MKHFFLSLGLVFAVLTGSLFGQGLPFPGPGIGITNVCVYSSNQIPAMTSATAPSGVASASTAGGGTAAWQAMSRVVADTWQATTNTGTLQYQFAVGTIVTQYTLQVNSASLGGAFAAKAPNTWTFQGSNDGAAWTTLDTQTGINTWSSGVTKTFNSFSNSTAYPYYRVNASSNNGDALIAVSIIQMMTC